MSGKFTYIYDVTENKAVDVNVIIDIAKEAGKEILEVYNTDYKIEIKADKSPVTVADKRSNAIIAEHLFRNFPDIPILSEEIKHESYNVRKDWNLLWVVDPLDGTKEFINKNGEFTVNIALLNKNKPVLGVIYVPVKHEIYFAIKNKGAYRIIQGKEPYQIKSKPLPENGKIVVVASRSHKNKALEDYVEGLKTQYDQVEYISAGSALKMCRVAEGAADIYPRLGPCMEWDTAAGHIIVNESGKKVYIFNSENELTYNKENLLNPEFICK